MLTPEEIGALEERAAELTEPIQEFLLRDIARRIAKAGQLTSTAQYQIWRTQQLGMSRKEIQRELQKLLKVSRKELRVLLTQSAEVGYRFDLERLPTEKANPFGENGTLQQIVAAAVDQAEEDFTNLTQTLGLVAPDGKAYPLQKAYQRCMDYAFGRWPPAPRTTTPPSGRPPRTWRTGGWCPSTTRAGYIPAWRPPCGGIS